MKSMRMENLSRTFDLMMPIQAHSGNCMTSFTTLQTIKVIQKKLGKSTKTNSFFLHILMTGNILCEPFLKLPSRRRYADYYREIKNPISLSRIRAKLAREDYGNLSELASDLSLMFENAKHYNRPDSKLFKDAVKLQRVMQTRFHELLADDEVRSYSL